MTETTSRKNLLNYTLVFSLAYASSAHMEGEGFDISKAASNQEAIQMC